MKPLLSKGLNFAVAPKRIHTEEIICVIELSIGSLFDEIRFETTKIIRSAKLPSRENIAFKKLKLNLDIVILTADKSNAIVILDSSRYSWKIDILLQDGS